MHVQRAYACLNPQGHACYAGGLWGLSACDGPSDEIQGIDGEPRRLFGYAARGVPYGPDDGTLSPPALLACLTRHLGRVVDRAVSSAEVWDENHDPFTNVLEVLIRRLRRKLDDDFEPKLIHTLRGAGYRFGP